MLSVYFTLFLGERLSSFFERLFQLRDLLTSVIQMSMQL